jgi:hypothetical protein
MRSKLKAFGRKDKPLKIRNDKPLKIRIDKPLKIRTDKPLKIVTCDSVVGDSIVRDCRKNCIQV